MYIPRMLIFLGFIASCSTCQGDFIIQGNASFFQLRHHEANSAYETADDGPAASLSGTKFLIQHGTYQADYTAGMTTSSSQISQSQTLSVLPAGNAQDNIALSIITAELETATTFELLDQSLVTLSINASPIADASIAGSDFRFQTSLSNSNGQLIASLFKRSNGTSSGLSFSSVLDPGVYSVSTVTIGSGFQATFAPVTHMTGTSTGVSTLSITAVPEPNTLLLTMVMMPLVVCMRRRRVF